MSSVLALDVGHVRVGVAQARSDLRMAIPLTTLARNDDDFWSQLQQLLTQNEVSEIVIGLPRGLDGQETDQTRAVQAFGSELTGKINLPIIWQDEALTSVKAESILRSQGKPYKKGDIDALAASLILTDYLETHRLSTAEGGEV
jgi:putative Holliday junction resolvase